MSSKTLSHLNHLARRTYEVLAYLLASGVLVQVFLIGMVVLGGQGAWLAYHRSFGNWLGILILLMLVAALLARLPIRMLAATVGLFVLYFMQFMLVGSLGGTAALRALHAVNAVILFWGTTYLIGQASHSKATLHK